MKTKTYPRFRVLSLGAALSTLLLAGSLQAQTIKLIDYDPALNNGGFESVTGGSPDVWTTGFNAIGFSSGNIVTATPSEGSQHLGVSSAGGRGVVQMTSHSAVAGDTFSLQFDWGAGYLWKPANSISWRLLTSSDDTVSGTATTIASGTVSGKDYLNNGTNPATNTYSTAMVLTNGGTVLAANEGQKVWLEIVGNSNGGAVEYAFVDAVQFSVNTTTSGGNTPPGISNIADLSIPSSSSTGPLAFTVADEDPASVVPSGGSSNLTLVPIENIVFGGSGANRSVTVTPVAGLSGSATITVTLTDNGGLTAQDTFVLTVNSSGGGNTPPAISDIAHQSIPSSGNTGPLAFTLADENPASVALNRSSSNLTLVPVENIVFGGSGTNRNVTVTPVAGLTGIATITVTLTDSGGLTAKDSFMLIVTDSYELIFSDEFNTDGPIDLTKWTPEIGFKRNNEAQYYRAENLSQSGGNLVITAKREQFPNANYDPNSSDWRLNRQYADWTSGSIRTGNSFDFLYGRIECRAKVTNLTGTWPAIWTVGGGEWPATGEIDIMENYGGKILANFAYAGSGRYIATWDTYAKSVSSLPAGWVGDYHLWVLEWSPSGAAILLDGVVMNTFNPATLNSSGAYTFPGVAPFQTFGQLLLLNLAIGAAGGSTTALPDETVYLVDYIRVYQGAVPTPQLSLEKVNAADLKFDWETVDGRRYSIYESTDLQNWGPVPVANERGTGQVISHTLVGAIDGPRKFFLAAPDNSPLIDPDTPAD